MKTNNATIYYVKGKTDERLRENIRYGFFIVDAVYSPIVGRIQLLCEVTHPHTKEKCFFLEEFVPGSPKLDLAMNNVFYPVERELIKSVRPEDFIDLCFSAELYYCDKELVIDWRWIIPEATNSSEMYSRYVEAGITVPLSYDNYCSLNNL